MGGHLADVQERPTAAGPGLLSPVRHHRHRPVPGGLRGASSRRSSSAEVAPAVHFTPAFVSHELHVASLVTLPSTPAVSMYPSARVCLQIFSISNNGTLFKQAYPNCWSKFTTCNKACSALNVNLPCHVNIAASACKCCVQVHMKAQALPSQCIVVHAAIPAGPCQAHVCLWPASRLGVTQAAPAVRAAPHALRTIDVVSEAPCACCRRGHRPRPTCSWSASCWARCSSASWATPLAEGLPCSPTWCGVDPNCDKQQSAMHQACCWVNCNCT